MTAYTTQNIDRHKTHMKLDRIEDKGQAFFKYTNIKIYKF